MYFPGDAHEAALRLHGRDHRPAYAEKMNASGANHPSHSGIDILHANQPIGLVQRGEVRGKHLLNNSVQIILKTHDARHLRSRGVL